MWVADSQVESTRRNPLASLLYQQRSVRLVFGNLPGK
jgi:hypothetical protein